MTSLIARKDDERGVYKKIRRRNHLSGGSCSIKYLQGIAGSDHGIWPVGQLKVELRDTEPAALATVTVTVGREPREQRPK